MICNIADEGTEISVDVSVVMNYLIALNAATSTFVLTKTSDSSVVASTVSYSPNKAKVTLSPNNDLSANTGYTLTCHAVDIAGQIKNTVITFTTV